MTYILDTNAFWKIINDWNSNISTSLISKLIQNNKITFSLPEISIMEIHSVLGKYIRGKKSEEIKCNRLIKNSITKTECQNIWITPKKRKLSKREAGSLIRLIKDILFQRNNKFDVSIIPLDSNIILTSQNLLQEYAYKFDFHSLDATVAASVVEKVKNTDDVVVITYDKKLKNILKQEQIEIE